ncbi:hypothetical protein JXB12_10135 [candidate division KSB1 bacterium]|nr:hypothetical protein [candidate division KSB1 bacterium]
MKRTFGTLMFMIFTLVLLILSAEAQTIIRVNCGGDAYRDHLGNNWSRDQAYRPGEWGYEIGGYALFYPTEIHGTVDDPLYQAERNALYYYRFTVPNGTYYVTLKFAELYYKKIGERIFHVDIEGHRVISDFDMVATAGFATAIDRTFPVQVNDGILDIYFITIEVAPGITIAHANIKAIAVIEQGTHEPLLWVNKTALNFGRNSFSQVFEVRNGGELPLEWTIFENPDEAWITNVTPTVGTLYQGQSAEVRVDVSRNGLGEGFYHGTLSIDSNGGFKNVDVSMEVKNDYPLLDVSRNALDFGAILTARRFQIHNRGTARLTWNAYNTTHASWLKAIEPSSGEINAGGQQEVVVVIDRTATGDSTMTAAVSVNTNAGNRNVEILANRGYHPLLINCGGGDYLDHADRTWFEDMHYQGGSDHVQQVEVWGTDDDPLYQHTRQGDLSYSIPLQENGRYRLALHFVETEYDEPQSRVFNVMVEDSSYYPSLDIAAETQAQTPLVRESLVDIADTTLNIELESVVDQPVIAAIELQKIPQDPYLSLHNTVLNFGPEETRLHFAVRNSGAMDLHWRVEKSPDCQWIRRVSPDSGSTGYGCSDSVWVVVDRRRLPHGLLQDTLRVHSNGGQGLVVVSMQVGSTEQVTLRVNAGGDDYVDTSGNEWKADQAYTAGAWGYLGGETYVHPMPVGETAEDVLYQSERWGLEGYRFDVPNGTYDVVLHFAEIYFMEAQRRVMDVLIEGDLKLDDFDIFSEAGYMKACVKPFQVVVNDQALDIKFNRGMDDPKISAIEIQSRFIAQPIPLERGVRCPAADNDQRRLMPQSLDIHQNYPNPFNMETQITFSLPYSAQVCLEVYNILGQRIKVLHDSPLGEGTYSYAWQGTDDMGQAVPSGFYLYAIHVIPDDSESHSTVHRVNKMLLLK